MKLSMLRKIVKFFFLGFFILVMSLGTSEIFSFSAQTNEQQNENSPKIHLVTVFNSCGMSLEIQDVVRKNVEDVQNFFKNRVHSSQLDVLPMIEGENLTPEMIFQNVNNLKIEKNDTLVFYYAGQGGRYDYTRGGQYFLLSHKKMTRSTLRDVCEQKRHRLTVLMTDCSSEEEINDDQAFQCFPSEQQNYKRADCAPICANLTDQIESETSRVIKTLFLKPEGVMDLTTAQIGQDPNISKEKGLLATRAWLITLQKIDDDLKKSPSMEISWRDVITKMNVESKNIYTDEDVYKNQIFQLAHIYEYPEKPSLGVCVTTIGHEVQIKEIFIDTPAATELKEGDVICSVNDSDINDESDFARAIDTSGKTVVLDVRGKNQSEIRRIEIVLSSKHSTSSADTTIDENREDDGIPDSSINDPNISTQNDADQ